MATRSERESLVGQVVADRYRILRLIGEGGMGQIYEATHTLIGRRFAIKVLSPHREGDATILARFRAEARAAGALEHEHVAAAVDFGETAGGTPFIVMEYLEGEDLGRLLERERILPVFRAVELIQQAARGLEAAHQRGLVHRDLKPENLFVTRRADGSDLVKLLDFGIAKLRCELAEPDPITRTGATLGTPHYMSPEQARGERDVDLRTDVYSLGVVLYEALCGRRPHEGDNVNEVLYHIMTRAPTPLSEHRPDLPAALLAVVARSLASDPAERFQSVHALGAALEPFSPQAALSREPPPAAASDITLETEPSAPSDGAGRAAPEPAQPRPRTYARTTAARLGVTFGVVVLVVTALLVGARAARFATTTSSSGTAPGSGAEPAPGTVPTAAPPPAAAAVTSAGEDGSAADTPSTSPPHTATRPGGRPPRRSPADGAATAPPVTSTAAAAHEALPTPSLANGYVRQNPYN